MSETVMYTGKIKKVELGNSSIEEWCQTKCKEIGIDEIPSYCDSWRETILSEDNVCIIVDDVIYEIVEKKEQDYSDYFIVMKPEEDGTLSFTTSFYNGGTCLSEMLEDGIKDLEK